MAARVARRRRGRRGDRGRRGGRWLRRVAVVVAAVCALTVALVLPWRWIAPPTTAFVLQARAQRGAAAVHTGWTPWREIPPWLRLAVVTAEDQKFPTHHGFDLQSIARALEDDPGRPRGASTLTQQVAKNLYLWPGRSLVRKALEAWLTIWIELLWPKRRILEVYLNVAEFAPGVFGVEPASRRLFGVVPSALSPWQSALLAAVLPSPRRMSAADPSPYVRERALEILRTGRELGGPAYLSGL